MSHVLLDGKYVDPAAIDPAWHRFLGMFRPPQDIFAGCTTDILCPCGESLRFVGQSRKHWSQGCQDVPQYVTIESGAVHRPNDKCPRCRVESAALIAQCNAAAEELAGTECYVCQNCGNTWPTGFSPAGAVSQFTTPKEKDK